MSQVQDSYPTVMPAMVDDPVNAININNIHRSSGVGDLWTLDEWAVNYGKMTDSDRYYKFPVPTLVPDMWLYGANKPPSQDDYNAEFTKLYPIVSEILQFTMSRYAVVRRHGHVHQGRLTIHIADLRTGPAVMWTCSSTVLTRQMKRLCWQLQIQL